MKTHGPRLINLDVNGRTWKAWQYDDGSVRPYISGASNVEPAIVIGGGGAGDGAGGGTAGSGGGGGAGGDGSQGNGGAGTAPGTIVIENDPPEPLAAPTTADLFKDPAVKALVEQVRQEEKDKLYPRLSAMEDEVAKVRQQREEQEAAAAQAEQQRQAEVQRLAEEEMDVRTLLATKEQEWEQRLEAVRLEAENDRAVFAMERQFQELQSYRAQAIAAAEDDLMPDLVEDFIPTTLTTREAIDAAVDRCKEKSLSIVQQMQQRTQEVRRQQTGVRPTGGPPVGPMENESSQRVLTGDDIKAMSIEEYAKNRDKILQQVSERARAAGPYGI